MDLFLSEAKLKEDDGHDMWILKATELEVNKKMHSLFDDITEDSVGSIMKRVLGNVGITPESSPNPKKKPSRIFMDGVFDMPHSGHYNAIRQAKQLGDVLVLGIVSDEETIRVKGPTVMNLAERCEIMRACKWVDEVIEGTTYDVTLQNLIDYNCDFYAHGDDLQLNADGEDAIKEIRAAGKFKVFKRTEGVSTTDVIGKLLSLTNESTTREAVEGPMSTN